MMENTQLEELVTERLSAKRQNHTRSVAKLAVELAQKYNASKEEAFTAAMLHDIAKEIPIDVQLQTLMASDIIDKAVLSGSTNLFHALSAFLEAKTMLNIENNDILNAIKYHTTGRVGLSLLEKIIFTADKVSYDRTYKEAKPLREMAFSDLDGCVIEIVKFLITDIVSENEFICTDTVDFYNSLIVEASNKKKQKTKVKN